jgi:hypothetical protein
LVVVPLTALFRPRRHRLDYLARDQHAEPGPNDGTEDQGRRFLQSGDSTDTEMYAMPRCDVCGNEYDNVLRITQGGKTMTFDSFECAIYAMAPRCAHCDCRVMGHGVEANGVIYCCAHCAKHSGVMGVSDRAA